MNIKETISFDGRNIDLEWVETREIPESIKISQVTGLCVDENNEILIIKNDRGWGFPGGHPELGETPEETLRRELAEEASVEIKDSILVGYVHASDPDNDSIEGKEYAQLRFFCRPSKIDEFKGEFETSERKFVSVDSLPEYIPWISSPVAAAQTESLKKLVR